MKITGDWYGNVFEVDASLPDRVHILETITRVDLQGITDSEIRFRPNLPADIVGAVIKDSRWDRRFLEVIDTTLRTPGAAIEAQSTAARMAIADQMSEALAAFPRH